MSIFESVQPCIMCPEKINRANQQLLKQMTAASVYPNLCPFPAFPPSPPPVPFGKRGFFGGPPNGSIPMPSIRGELIVLTDRQTYHVKKHCPEAYMLIVQQHQKIHQQRMRLKYAASEIDRLREEVEALKAEKKKSEDDKIEKKETRNDVVENSYEENENVPPEKKSQSGSLGSPSGTVSTDSFRNKKRNLGDEFQRYNEYYEQRMNYQSLGKKQCTMPNGPNFTSYHAYPMQKQSHVTIEKDLSPNIATVAATLAAAVSPSFKTGLQTFGKQQNNRFAF